MIKENEVRSYSQTIADNINLEDLTELLNQVTESGDICVHLIGANGEQIQESGKFRYCSLQEMDATARAILFRKVQEKGGTKMVYFNAAGKENLPAPFAELAAKEKSTLGRQSLFSQCIKSNKVFLISKLPKNWTGRKL